MKCQIRYKALERRVGMPLVLGNPTSKPEFLSVDALGMIACKEQSLRFLLAGMLSWVKYARNWMNS